MELTQERLKELLHYYPNTGEFTWKIKTSRRVVVSQRAGTVDSFGYRRIKILGKVYFEHRLAWFYMTGHWPKNDIDHKNNLRDDNRFENLREATRKENTRNKSKSTKTCHSKYKGVSKNKGSNKWIVQIRKQGRCHHLGYFDCEIEAAKAYNKVAKELHGEFARLNPV